MKKELRVVRLNQRVSVYPMADKAHTFYKEKVAVFEGKLFYVAMFRQGESVY